MRRLLMFGGLLGAFLLAPAAFGADGRQCQDSDNNDIPLRTLNNWIPVGCIQLCDGKAEADSGCTEWDFANYPGLPDILILEYEEDPDNANCSGTPDYTIKTGPVTNGGTTGDGVPAYDLETAAVVLNPTTDRVVIVTKDAPLDRFLFTTILDDADCTNVDVRMFMYDRKSSTQ